MLSINEKKKKQASKVIIPPPENCMHMHPKTELQRVEHLYWHDLSMRALYQSHTQSQVLHTYDATNTHDLKTNHYQNT